MDPPKIGGGDEERDPRGPSRGLSVVAPPGLEGTVTATLRDVPWDQALDLVLAGNGWGFVREGTVIRIVRRDDPAR